MMKAILFVILGGTLIFSPVKTASAQSGLMVKLVEDITYSTKTPQIGPECTTAVSVISHDGNAAAKYLPLRKADAEPEPKLECLGEFKLTFYCNCRICCGQWAGGKTASGTTPKEGRTIAVDPRKIPYGTEIIIGDHTFIAEDKGGAIKGNRIDVFVSDHQKALDLGVKYSMVYKVK